MLDRLPENGASACRLPDPQAKVAVALYSCANPKCKQIIYRGDEVLRYDDLYFCDEECLLEWLRSEGVLETVYAGEVS